MKNFVTYQLALELYKECAVLKAEYYLRDQLCRASLSIVLNIAEGAAKQSPKDRKRFYGIAYASLKETQTLIDILAVPALANKADKLGAFLYKLMVNTL